MVQDIEDAAPAWAAAHAAACAKNEPSYIDPASGYLAFTELGLREQGGCCGGACRHCPYGQHHVPANKRDARVLPTSPVLLNATKRRGRARPPSLAVGLRAALCDSLPLRFQSAVLAVLFFDSRTGLLLFADGAAIHLHAAFDALLEERLSALAFPLSGDVSLEWVQREARRVLAENGVVEGVEDLCLQLREVMNGDAAPSTR